MANKRRLGGPHVGLQQMATGGLTKQLSRNRKPRPEATASVLRRPKEAGGVGNAKPDTPLYAQISHILREEILNGVYPVGSQLPKEETLCSRFAVSRFTVREALRRLRDDGLVHSRQGAGTVVVPSRPADSYVHQVMAINDLVDFAISTKFVIESVKMAAIGKDLAERIKVAIGQEWLVVIGYRYAKDSDVSVCRAEYYIDRKFAAVGRLLPRHTGPIFPLIEGMFAVTIAEVHQEISATLMTSALADIFKVKSGSPALEVLRTYKSSTGKLVQATVTTHPGSRYRPTMTMRRVKG